MNKKQFLNQLEKELKIINYEDVESVISYYDELIEDQKEKGKKEKEIISNLGDINKIIKNIEVDKTLSDAREKPTVSNSWKAAVAILGVLSLPLLIPIIIVIGVMAFAALIIIFSIVIVLLSVIISAIAATIVLFTQLFLGKLPFVSFIFALGLAFITIGLSIILSKWLFLKLKELVIWFISRLQKKFRKRNEVIGHE